MRCKPRASWSEKEDNILRQAVKEYGTTLWTKVAERLHHRTNKQCRERWLNHLSPMVNKAPWSSTEDELILDFVRKHGSKWATIAKKLEGRPDNAVKKRFQVLERRGRVDFQAKRAVRKTKDSSSEQRKTRSQPQRNGSQRLHENDDDDDEDEDEDDDSDDDSDDDDDDDDGLSANMDSDIGIQTQDKNPIEPSNIINVKESSIAISKPMSFKGLASLPNISPRPQTLPSVSIQPPAIPRPEKNHICKKNIISSLPSSPLPSLRSLLAVPTNLRDDINLFAEHAIDQFVLGGNNNHIISSTSNNDNSINTHNHNSNQNIKPSSSSKDWPSEPFPSFIPHSHRANVSVFLQPSPSQSPQQQQQPKQQRVEHFAPSASSSEPLASFQTVMSSLAPRASSSSSAPFAPAAGMLLFDSLSRVSGPQSSPVSSKPYASPSPVNVVPSQYPFMNQPLSPSASTRTGI